MVGCLSGVVPVSEPRLRAPSEDGAVLAHPPLADFGHRLDHNRSLFAAKQIRISGMPLAELRRAAIAEAKVEARNYFRDADEPIPDLSSESLLLAGHQPELFHPGVWLKNFALNALARRHGAVPVNLVVDNDTAKATSIRVPVLREHKDPTDVHAVTMPFDHFAGEVAFEERTVRDEAEFAAFPKLVAERTSDWGFTPMLAAFWDDVVRQRERTPLLGERLTAARRTWERRWGCHNLEVPLSRLCRTPAFARFAVDLVDRLPEFHATYNDRVHDYRRRHRIRSDNHPVPDLQREGDWLEAPFWAWRTGGQRRGRLFVRHVAGGWQLRSGGEPWPDLPRERAIDRWRKLEDDGFKIRTRALTTTLFARLCLADLFIHGIGGGKYDELTDAIMARHFGIDPPDYLVLTGTLHLPLPAFPATADDGRAARRRLRDIHWNPQRHLSGRRTADVAARVALVREHPEGHPQRAERFRELRALADRMRPMVVDELVSAERTAERIDAEVAANAMLLRRDYAFCLYPESSLRPFLTQFQLTSSRR
jgi:hypothetical protein